MSSTDYVKLKRALVERMEHYEEKLNEMLKEDRTKITCKRGCVHCCYLMTTIHPLEGLLLAEEVLKRPHWRRKAAALGENAKACHEAGTDRAEYFRRHVPCPFLDLKTNDCEVYKVRPSPCRYHVVITPVEKCFHTYVGDDIGHVDATIALADVLKFCIDSTQIGAASPVSLMVLWCMEQLLGGKDNRKFVKRLREGLPHPLQWMEYAMKGWDFSTDTDDYKAARKNAFTQVFGEEAVPYYEAVMKSQEGAHA